MIKTVVSAAGEAVPSRRDELERILSVLSADQINRIFLLTRTMLREVDYEPLLAFLLGLPAKVPDAAPWSTPDEEAFALLADVGRVTTDHQEHIAWGGLTIEVYRLGDPEKVAALKALLRQRVA